MRLLSSIWKHEENSDNWSGPCLSLDTESADEDPDTDLKQAVFQLKNRMNTSVAATNFHVDPS